MRILALDTATRATTVALDGLGDEVLEARDDPEPGERPRHAATLLPLAERLLERAGIRFGDVELIAVGGGPEALAAELPRLGARVLAIGEGAVEFRSELERSGAAIPDDRAELHRVTAVGHCQIARRLEPTTAVSVVPEYLRPPDVK